MNPKFKTLVRSLGCAVFAAGLLVHGSSVAIADDKAGSQDASDQVIKDQRALDMLKSMSDTLASAQTLSFKVRGLVPFTAPTGQYISLFASSRVVMQRPDKLFVESRGDLFPSDIYYDGKTLTAVGLDKNFYAQREARGRHHRCDHAEGAAGLGHPGALRRPARLRPLRGLRQERRERAAGRAIHDRRPQDRSPRIYRQGIDWEVWIGTADKLPRLMVVSYREGERQPTFTVEFSDWNIDAPVPARTFNAAIPKDAVKLEFKLHGLPQTK